MEPKCITRSSLWQAARANHESAQAQNEALLAQQEADRANKALNDLQAAAPSIAADARALAARGLFDSAMEKLDYAVKLQPDAPALLVDKGDIYLCQLKLSEAAVAYHDALRLSPGFVPAQAKSELCDQILAIPLSTQGKLNLDSLVKIYAALEPEKRSDAELRAVKEAYAAEKERLCNYWQQRLKSLPMFAKIVPGGRVWDNLFDIRNDGQLILYPGYLDCSDVSQLKDLPVAGLYLANCKNLTDVQPLADMPSLEDITVPTLARNIEALHKLPKLKRLSFAMNNGASIDEHAQVVYGEQVYSSVLGAQQQKQGSNNPLDINALMRRAELFDIHGRFGSPTPDTTAEEFWKEYSTLSWFSRLRDSAIKPIGISRHADGTWELDYSNKKELTDLSFLHGMPISVRSAEPRSPI